MFDGLDALHQVLLRLRVRVQGLVLRHGGQVTAGLLMELEEKDVRHPTGATQITVSELDRAGHGVRLVVFGTQGLDRYHFGEGSKGSEWRLCRPMHLQHAALAAAL